jgi:hypothetical protein
MAGRARARALADALERRTRDYFGAEPDEPQPTTLDYVCARIESGTTTKAIAAELETTVKFPVDYAMLMRHLRAEHGEATDERVDEARVRASHLLVEHALELVDAPADTMFQVSKAASQARQRNWMAERYNATRYGSQKGVSVSISVGSLHLDALRALPARATAIVTPTAQQALASPAVEVAEVVQVVE